MIIIMILYIKIYVDHDGYDELQELINQLRYYTVENPIESLYKGIDMKE